MRAPYVVTSLMAIALAACSAHSTGTPGEVPLVRDGGALPSGPSTRGDRAADAGRPRDGGTGSAAALNYRLMEQAAKSGDTGDLPVGTGDLLEISVFEVEELSKIRVRVPGRGVIALPLVGQIDAAGHTTAELEEEIRTRLKQKFMHEPQVSVFIQEQQSQRISVIGAVRKGGVFSITRPLRLADALAMAEGLTDEADRQVYVIRRTSVSAVNAAAARSGTAGVTAAATGGGGAGGNGPVDVMAPIDLSDLADGREDLNVQLQAGDVVNVPRAGSVYVGGSVERPGSFLLRGKTTAQQAIFAAGGVKDVADWSDVRLYRKSPSGKVEVTTYDLEAFEKGAPAPELQRNDVLVVGKHAGKAFLYGFLDFFKGALGVAKGI